MSTRQSTTPELPELDAGVHCLETDGDETGPLQSLALDHVLTAGGDARWVDAMGRATTTTLARLAPSPRLLERIRVARGFTAHQHHRLVERLETTLHDGTTLAVCPAVDGLYREAPDDGRRLLASTLGRLEGLADDHDLTVLVTRTRADEFAAPVVDGASRLRCTATRFGPRFVGEGFETLVYPDGEYVQTTLAFWARVLGRRRAATGESPEVGARGAH